MKELKSPQIDHTERLEPASILPTPSDAQGLLREQLHTAKEQLYPRMRAIIHSGSSKKLHYRTPDQSEPEFTRAWIESAAYGGTELKFVTDEAAMIGDRTAIFEGSEIAHLRVDKHTDDYHVPGETIQQKLEVLEAINVLLGHLAVENGLAEGSDAANQGDVS